MFKNFASTLILGVIYCTAAWAKPETHTLRIRFPGPISDNVVLSQPAKQNTAPYPAAGFKPEPAFELPLSEPELIYGPPTEPELSYGPPDLTYGPPAEPELLSESAFDTYGPPEHSYAPPDNTYHAPEFNKFPSAAIINAPLTQPTQFTPPRPNKAVNFRPIIRPSNANIINKPVNHLTLPSTQRVVFRPRRPQNQSQKPLYPKIAFTLPRVERVIEFRPRRVPQQHQANNIFGRPLPTSIFGNSQKSHGGRQLPSKIFSN